MYKLDLRIQPGAWGLFSKRRDDPRFKKFAEKIWIRDNYTCQFCGFQATEYQEINNIDHDYLNNKLSNLVTSCCFCTQAQFIDAVGVGYGGGTLIKLAKISQAELNSLCHVLFCAITNDTGYKETAQAIYRSFKKCEDALNEQLGDGVSDPSMFAQLYVDSKNQLSDEKNEHLFTTIRLLPSRARFRTQIEHWARAALEDVSADDSE